MKWSIENAFHINDRPSPKSHLSHHDPSCLWTARIHLMDQSIFFLSFLLFFACLWNTCSHQNAHAAFSLPQWSERFFVVDTFLFWRCPYTESSLPHMGVGVLSFSALFTASKSSVIPFPGCQYSRLKSPTGLSRKGQPAPSSLFSCQQTNSRWKAQEGQEREAAREIGPWTQFSCLAFPPFSDSWSQICILQVFAFPFSSTDTVSDCHWFQSPYTALAPCSHLLCYILTADAKTQPLLCLENALLMGTYD